jgi:hypothetical protein
MRASEYAWQAIAALLIVAVVIGLPALVRHLTMSW